MAPLNFVIRSVDQEPDDLPRQLPLHGRLVPKIGGPPRRPEYWLAELAAPLSWTSDGASRPIGHLILTAHWEDTAISPGAKIGVNIWYVLDDAVLSAESFEPSQATFAAIGTVCVSSLPFWLLRPWSAVFGRA